MWRRLGIGLAGVVGLCLAAPVQAQTWSASAKIVKGDCGDGAIVQVSETPSKVDLKFFIGSTQTAQTAIALGSDGGGKTQYSGRLGDQIVEIQAGRGKRQLKSGQLFGHRCEWTWTPQ